MAFAYLFDPDFEEFIDHVEDFPYQLLPRRYLRDAENPLACYSGTQFLKRFRFSKEIVVDIIMPLCVLDNANNRGLPVPPIMKITTALRFYGSGSFQVVCGDLVHLNQATVSRIVKVVSHQLADQLLEYVYFPNTEEEWVQLRQKFYSVGNFPGVIGCVDCTHVAIKHPGGENGELYRNRKRYMSLNVQVVSGPSLEILDIVTRWAGSTHDARIFNNSRLRVRLEQQQLPGLLLGDNGYPQLPFLFTPLLEPGTAAEQRYNIAHRRTRNLVERLFGVLKKRFPCLGLKLRTNLATSVKIILACAVLHNISIRTNDHLPEGHDNILPEIDMPNICQRNHRGALIRAAFIQCHFN